MILMILMYDTDENDGNNKNDVEQSKLIIALIGY